MKALLVIITAAMVACLAGCAEKPPPPADTLPSVTLTSREDQGDQILLTFTFEHMERAIWRGRVLRAQILKRGDKPVAGGPVMTDPAGTITVAVAVAKSPLSEAVLFVPMWGKSAVAEEMLDLPAPGGQVNRVALPGFAEHRIRQVMLTATGPDRAVPFQPDKGIDLLTVGKVAPDIYVLRVWAERAD
jgi:hypothetical protein